MKEGQIKGRIDSHLVKVGSVDVWIQHWNSWFFLSQMQDEKINNDNSTWVFLPGSQGVTWKVVEFFLILFVFVRSPWNLRLHMCWYVFWGRSVCHHALQTFGQNLCQSFFFFRPRFCFFCPNQLPIYQFKGSVHHLVYITGLHPKRCSLFVLGKSKLMRSMNVREWQMYILYVGLLMLLYYIQSHPKHNPTSCLNI